MSAASKTWVSLAPYEDVPSTAAKTLSPPVRRRIQTIARSIPEEVAGNAAASTTAPVAV
jgi:hypothetical protein